jgi:hypothetical protein
MQGVQLLEENKQLKQKVRICSKVAYNFVCQDLNSEIKRDWIWKQIATIYKGKGPALVDLDTAVQEEGMSSESTTNVCSCSSGPPVEDDSSDTSLKLGWA